MYQLAYMRRLDLLSGKDQKWTIFVLKNVFKRSTQKCLQT